MSQKQYTNDLYGTLGISKDAQTNEIQKAYRRLALTFHPDRFVDEQLREKAQLRFRDIKHAYDVLSNEDSRSVYDKYGPEAVEIYTEMKIESGGKKTQKDFIREFHKIRKIQHFNYFYERVSQQGSLTTLFNAEDLIDVKRKRINNPLLLASTLRQQVRFPVYKNNEFVLGCKVVSSTSLGSGSITTKYKHRFGSFAFAEIAAETGWNVLNVHTKGWVKRGSYSGELKIGLLGEVPLKLRISKEIDEERKVGTSFEWGKRPTLSVEYSKESEEDTYYAVNTFGNLKSVGVDVTGSIQVSKKTSVGGTVSVKKRVYPLDFSLEGLLSHFKIDLSGHLERSISDTTKAHISFTIAHYGVFITFGITRLRQTYQLPILISSMVTPWSVLSAFFSPLTALYLVNAIFIAPKKNRKREERLRRNREKVRERIKEEKQKADAFKESIAEDILKLQELEDAKKGLIILQAFYGRSPDNDSSITGDSISEEDVIDVTMPLQYLVRNSKLQLQETSKSHLLGFYDPCPGEEKYLEVLYLFNEKTHRAVVPDNSRLRIPLRSHLVNDPNLL